MATIPNAAPQRLTAGDTLAWRITLADYPASAGWVLSYRLINAAGKIDILSTADSDDHFVNVSAATSAEYVAGQYTRQALVTKGTERYSLRTDTCWIDPDLAAMPAGFDARSTAAKALDDLRAALAAWLTNQGAVQEYEIAGRRMKFATAADIQQRIALAEREVAREVQAQRLAAGLPVGRSVHVRF